MCKCIRSSEKTKTRGGIMKILPQIIACIALGAFLGMAFWLCDGGKARPKVSERLEMAFKKVDRSLPVVKIYQGQWVEDIIKVGDYWSVGYLEVTK